jgi:hypothetical protein
MIYPGSSDHARTYELIELFEDKDLSCYLCLAVVASAVDVSSWRPAPLRRRRRGRSVAVRHEKWK